MSSVIYVKYIGKKARCRDRLYDSGVTWHGFGDIRPVDAGVATRLLSHTDEFAEASEQEYQQQAAVDHEQEAVDPTQLEAARARAERGVASVSEATRAAQNERDSVAQAEQEAEPASEPDEPEPEGEQAEETVESEEAPADNATEEADEAEGPTKPEKPVSQMSKRACAEYAERQFGHEIDVDNLDVHACRKEVRELMVGAGLIQ